MDAIINWVRGILVSFSDAIYLALISEDRYQLLLRGMKNSLVLTLIAGLVGVIIGLLLAIVKLMNPDAPSKNWITRGLRKWLIGFANGYISIVRGTPAVVQLLIIYFVLYLRILKNIPPFSFMLDYQIAGVAFGINSGAYVAEIIRAGILAVDRGQTEAGRSLGLSSGKTMRFIVIPQAVKNVLPALGNEFIVLLKETSIAGYIGISDLTKQARSIGSSIYNYIVPLTCAAYIYFLMTTLLTLALNYAERRMRRSD